MNLDYIEDLINRENINLINTYLEDTNGAYVHYDNPNLNLILYDNSKLTSSIDRKETFAQELGHYYYDATYKFNSDLFLISKQEYRANKWVYNTLISFEKLKSALKKRY